MQKIIAGDFVLQDRPKIFFYDPTRAKANGALLPSRFVSLSKKKRGQNGIDPTKRLVQVQLNFWTRIFPTTAAFGAKAMNWQRSFEEKTNK